ncbi:mitochondrial distribution and morphology, partial [Spiromyces aspiralis]
PPSKLVWDYIDRFGAKAVCFSDLKPYVISWFGKTQGFLAEFRLTLESKFADAVATFADNKAMPVERLATLQKFAWLASYFDTENSPASSLDRAKTLIEIGLTKDCAEEQQLALGELVLLGCHYLIFAAQKFEELEDVSTAEALRFQSLCMLLAGLRRNKDDFQLKLLAIRLYNQLGGYMHARELYQSLNNRNVQHDTLSYLIVGHGAIFGHRQQDLDAIYDALEIYQQSEAQMPGMIKLAFENGVYSKVPEFVEFQRRLTNSIQQAVSIRYATRNEIVGLRNGADALREWQQVDLGVFKGKPVSRLWDDNRDTDVLFCCSPPDNDRRSIERLTRTLPLPDEHWIDVFGEISKLMVHISNRDVGQAQRSVEKLEELLEKGEDPEDSSLPAHELVLARNTLSLGKFAIKALRDGDKVVADAGKSSL